MSLIEVSVRLENKPGQLSRVSELIGEQGINILALTVSTESGQGVLHFLATDPARAAEILTGHDYRVSTQEILACQTPHHPGGLNAILKPLKAAEINVEHLYPCIGSTSGGQTVLLLLVSDLARAREALRRNWIIMLGDEICFQRESLLSALALLGAVARDWR